MNSRIVAIGSWLLVSALVGCSGDDTGAPATDGGVDGGDASVDSGGSGGSSGGGSGGHSGGGSGGHSGTGGESGSGGKGGSGGSGDARYSVGGDISGLKGTGLVLKLNSTDELAVSDNGSFMFELLLAAGDDYSVTVTTQPSDPIQACAVENGDGSVGDSDVSNVKITCSDVVKSIGGTLSGLGGGQIVLKNNGSDDLTLAQDGTFNFATPLNQGADYAVTIATAPAGRTCSITGATGKVGGSNVTSVEIACYADLDLAARARVGSVAISWNDNAATSYTAYLSTDAACDFSAPDTCAGASKREAIQSPYVWTGLQNGTTYYFHVRGSHPNDFVTRSNVSGARPNLAILDGQVSALALAGDGTVYVGGAFQSVGAFTGPLVPLDKTTARPSRMPSFPIIAGSVSAVLPDGTGGYYVGGAFAQEVGSDTLTNLVHVLPSGAIDGTWKPDPNGTVTLMARVGTTLYVAGAFTMVGGAARAGLAAVSTQGAGSAGAWNPTLTGSVTAMVANDSTLFLGGNFTQVDSTARNYLASFDVATGNLNAFDPAPNLSVTALALGSDTLYVAGYFDSIGSGTPLPCYRLAALDFTGAAKTDFTPRPDLAPATLAVSGSTLYLGGDFSEVRGTSAATATARGGLAAVDAMGEVTAWAPEPDAAVQVLAASGGSIYVGGDFDMIGGKARAGLAAVDAQGSVTDWDPHPGKYEAADAVSVLAVDSDTVYAAGLLVRTYGAEAHAKLAAFKEGALGTWSPQVTGGDVLALAVSGTTVYAGGDFDAVGSVTPRYGAAAIDSSGTATSWDAQLSQGASVHALLVDSGNVYLGGEFTRASTSQNLVNLVALTADTAAVPSGWELAGTDGSVDALAMSGSRLYVGGGFSSAGGTRSRLAALDATTGAVVDGWDPGADGRVLALAVTGDYLVVGGEFAMLGGAAHGRLGAVASDGTVPSWDPAVDQPVRALAVDGDVVHVGGEFSSFAGNAVSRLAKVDATGGAFTYLGGSPGVSLGNVSALAVDATSLYLGGDFRDVNSAFCRYFCVYMP